MQNQLMKKQKNKWNDLFVILFSTKYDSFCFFSYLKFLLNLLSFLEIIMLILTKCLKYKINKYVSCNFYNTDTAVAIQFQCVILLALLLVWEYFFNLTIVVLIYCWQLNYAHIPIAYNYCWSYYITI